LPSNASAAVARLAARARDGSCHRKVHDFNDATFDYYAVRSRFFRRDGKFFRPTGRTASPPPSR
jgi:hypothetical protein